MCRTLQNCRAKLLLCWSVERARPLVHASDILDALERGQRGDAEAALGDSCAWVHETLELAENDFARTIASVSGDVNACAVAVCDALQRRSSTVHTLNEYVKGCDLFSRLQALTSTDSAAWHRWNQRKARLQHYCQAYSLQAAWCGMVSRQLLTLKLTDPSKSQSLDSLEELMPAIAQAACILLLTIPRSADPSSTKAASNLSANLSLTQTTTDPAAAAPNLWLLLQEVMLRVSFDLVRKCELLLNFKMKMDPNASLAPTEDSRDATQATEKLPLCAHEAYRQQLVAAQHILLKWRELYLRMMVALNAPANAFQLCDVAGNPNVVAQDKCIAPVLYAAGRCADVAEMLSNVSSIGRGLMTPEVRCLFGTMHRAATKFSILSSAEFKNWQRFYEAFQKAVTLKYHEVEDVLYEPPCASLPPEMSGINVSVTDISLRVESTARSATALSVCRGASPSSIANTTVIPIANVAELPDGMTVQSLLEERAILASRVAMMSEELSECRELVSTLQSQLEHAQTALDAASEMNIVLLSELRESRHRALVEAVASATTEISKESECSPSETAPS